VDDDEEGYEPQGREGDEYDGIDGYDEYDEYDDDEDSGDRDHEDDPRYRRQPRNRNRRRAALLLTGVIALLATAVGGVVWLGSGYDDEGSRATGGAGQAGTSAQSGVSGGGLSTEDGGSGPGAAIPGGPGTNPAHMPYVTLSPGTCYDAPGLDSTVSVVTKVSCTTPHDGEVISDEHLTGTFTDEAQLRTSALALCAPDARARLKSLPKDGKTYYNYALYPDLTTYQKDNKNTVSCTLTLTNTPNGKHLTAPLAQ
jgi:hypothetical protein